MLGKESFKKILQWIYFQNKGSLKGSYGREVKIGGVNLKKGLKGFWF